MSASAGHRKVTAMPMPEALMEMLTVALSSAMPLVSTLVPMTSPTTLPPNAKTEEIGLFQDTSYGVEISYEPTEQTNRVMSEERSLGDEVAWLAVQMAATASPDERPTAPNHDVWSRTDDPRVANEIAIMDALEEICPEFNCAYASCNQAAGAVLSAVVDMDMTPHDNASGGPPTMLEWLRSHPENWMRIDSHDEEDLCPGDVICGPGHTAIYVGHDLPQEKFPGTTGCVYEASFSIAAYAGIDGFWVSSDAEVYRPIKRNDSSIYPSIDYRAIIAENEG